MTCGVRRLIATRYKDAQEPHSSRLPSLICNYIKKQRRSAEGGSCAADGRQRSAAAAAAVNLEEKLAASVKKRVRALPPSDSCTSEASHRSTQLRSSSASQAPKE